MFVMKKHILNFSNICKRKKKQKMVSAETEKHLTLGKLADAGEHTYWKFGQSQKGRSIESVFAKYEPGKITIAEDKDKLLSFVSESNIAKCYCYGDLLIKFVFDGSNKDFKMIKNSQVRYIGGGLGEYESEKLLTEECYSLEKVETIRKIFELCNSENDFLIIFYGILNKNLEYYLRKYEFMNTADLLSILFASDQHIRRNLVLISKVVVRINRSNRKRAKQRKKLIQILVLSCSKWKRQRYICG